jgi:hypothetical protein
MKVYGHALKFAASAKQIGTLRVPAGNSGHCVFFSFSRPRPSLTVAGKIPLPLLVSYSPYGTGLLSLDDGQGYGAFCSRTSAGRTKIELHGNGVRTLPVPFRQQQVSNTSSSVTRASSTRLPRRVVPVKGL